MPVREASKKEKFCILADLLIPGKGEPIKDGCIIVENNKILSVGKAEDIAWHHSDLPKTHVPVLMPGMWDCHVHLIGIQKLDVSEFVNGAMNQALTGARCARDVMLLLDSGFTSVREMAGYGIQLSKAIAEGTLVGPTIYSSNVAISMTGGHADIHSLHRPWYEDACAHGLPMYNADGVPECLKAVRMQLRVGAKVIKICGSGGVGSENDDPRDHRRPPVQQDVIKLQGFHSIETLIVLSPKYKRQVGFVWDIAIDLMPIPWMRKHTLEKHANFSIPEEFSEEEMRAMVEEAARAKRVVAAHCHGKPGIMAALRAGVKTIEHGSYIDEEAADLMKEKDAMMVATRLIIENGLNQKGFFSDYAYQKLLATAKAHEKAMKIAIEKGVKLATGTDTAGSIPGNKDLNFNVCGKEFGYLVQAGMTPLQAIEAGTANGPLTLGPQAPKAGLLKAGYDADFIALDENPLDDIKILSQSEHVTHVWKQGKLYKSPGNPVTCL